MSTVALICVGAALALVYYYLFGGKRRNLPPGPPGLPLIGNITQMPRDEPEYIQFTKWAQKYGPVYSLKFAHIQAVVLADPHIIREAFNNSALTGRPDNAVFRSFGGGDYGVLAMDGPIWAELRRFTLRHLRDFGFGKNTMETLILDEAKELVEGFKADEGKSIPMTRRFNIAVLNSLWTIVTGTRLDHSDKRANAILEEFFKQLDQTFVQGTLWLTPWLRHIAPEMSGWNSLVRSVDAMADFFSGIIQQHEKELDDHEPRDFIDSFLMEIRKNKNPESSFAKSVGHKHLVAVISDLFAAGGETTSTTMEWAVLYLASYPEVQKELQKEIDDVVGHNRLPSLSDKASMPYTEALMLELLRVSSIASIGLIHTALEDTKIEGFDIPKGTFIFPLFQWPHHNPKYWDTPDESFP